MSTVSPLLIFGGLSVVSLYLMRVLFAPHRTFFDRFFDFVITWRPASAKTQDRGSAASKARVHHSALEVVGIVAILYVLNLAALLVLSRIGPVSGQVDALIKQFGGNIAITVAGIVGAFLALFVASFVAVRILFRAF